MDLGLDGKSVVITGGASGIGFASAHAFAREGARIAIFDWNQEKLAKAEAAIAELGAQVIVRKVDVSQANEVDAAHAHVIDAFGGIDIGFNNAGVGSSFRPIEETSEEDWDRVIAINLKGVFLCVRAQIRHMRTRGRGTIVNTASNVAFAGAPGGTAYVATKHGIVGITRSVALEVASTDIRVNCIAPGAVNTSIGESTGRKPGQFVDAFPDAIIRKGLPIGRFGEPHEIADAVVWLASPRAGLAHGETLVVDGGFLAQ